MTTPQAPFGAKLINRDPPLVSDGERTYPLDGLRGTPKTGDWLRVSPKLEGRVAFLGLERETTLPFPGPEWARFQLPQREGRTRMEALRFRARLFQGVRDYFNQLGFWEVETPIRVPSPGVEPHLTAVQSGHWFLSPSPEFQMKRLLAGGSGSIYQFQKCFRGEERGQRHNPEFTMLEWYSVGATGETLRQETEGLLAHLMRSLQRTPLPSPPYRRLTMAEAFSHFAGIENYREAPDTLYLQAGLPEKSGRGHTWEEAFFTILSQVIEPALVPLGPVFLTHWPMEFASLSRPVEGRTDVADRFELYAGGLELANGFFELTDHAVQRRRSLTELDLRKREGLPQYPLDERFLSALAEGLPETAGIALGMDRLAMLFWGTDEISTVLTFTGEEL